MSEAKASDRRMFLTGGLAGAAAGVVGAAAAGVFGGAGPKGKAAAVHTGQRVQWRLASSFPAYLDTIYGAAEVLSQRVAAMTDGAFTITPYQAGELLPGLEVLGGTQRGSVEVGQTAGYYYIGKAPALAFDTCVPFGLTPRQQNAWLHEAGGLERVRALYADFNLISFPCGNTGAQMGGWFKRPIETLGDLRGLKMRIPGLGGMVMASLGVNVQNLPGGEITQALERGAIDAAEWVGPYDDEKQGFHQVAQNYFYPGWWEPGPSLSFLVNLDAWASLPRTYQEIFTAASAEAASAMQQRYDARNPAALKRILATGIDLRPFSDGIMEGAREASMQLVADEAAKDGTYRDLLEHWRAFRDESFAWFGTAELAYARFAWS
jgi:TRAP-type mannitol/chloroaromatic compound transport system substrate-binding protein